VLSGLGGKALLSKLREQFLGRVDKLQERVRETEAHLSHVKQISNKQWFYNLGETYRLRERWEDANWAYEEAVKLDGKYTSAILGLAKTARDEASATSDAERSSTLLELAMKYCNQAVDIEPDFGPTYLDRATVRAARGNPVEEIRRDLESAVSRQPGLSKFIPEEPLLEGFKQYEWFRKLTEQQRIDA
jgi:tetratricopeptide (TPR) repeat protein